MLRGEFIMHIRLIAVAGALLLLVACGTRPDPAPGLPGGPGGPGGMGGLGAPGGPGGIGSAQFGPGSQQDLVATAGDRVFFAFDSAEISPEGQQILQRQAEWLRRYPNVDVTIEGHCDERGTREYNLALGERRAQAATNVLVALGISAARLSTISFGKERPAVPGSSEDAYAQNRRAVTVIN
jgi:peptidoglycan-associated lipoprotein